MTFWSIFGAFLSKSKSFKMALEGESSGLVVYRGLNVIRNVKKFDVREVWKWASAGRFFGRAKFRF